jgi:hypothetical protein
MEADWEFEIGPGAPVIDAHWEGHIDLVTHPEQTVDLPEVAGFPQLADTLVQLNGSEAFVWTSKCDLWQVDPDETPLDADELDAPAGTAEAARACYIDLMTSELHRWENPDRLAQDCAALSARLRSVALRSCRTDLVIRRAVLADGEATLGVTAYLTACGPSEEAAGNVLGQALYAFADSVSAVWMR